VVLRDFGAARGGLHTLPYDRGPRT
jgi:hypothetical protein